MLRDGMSRTIKYELYYGGGKLRLDEQQGMNAGNAKGLLDRKILDGVRGCDTTCDAFPALQCGCNSMFSDKGRKMRGWLAYGRMCSGGNGV
jgi:hypothetical protein